MYHERRSSVTLFRYIVGRFYSYVQCSRTPELVPPNAATIAVVEGAGLGAAVECPAPVTVPVIVQGAQEAPSRSRIGGVTYRRCRRLWRTRLGAARAHH